MKIMNNIATLLSVLNISQPSLAADAAQLKCYHVTVNSRSGAHPQDLEPMRVDAMSFKLESDTSTTTISRDLAKSATINGQNHWYVEMNTQQAGSKIMISQGAWVSTNGEVGNVIGRLPTQNAQEAIVVVCGSTPK